MDFFYSKNMYTTRARHTQHEPYYARIVTALADGAAKTFDEIMSAIGEPASKQTYAVDGLKRLIGDGRVEKIVNPAEKRLFVGHSYRLVHKSAA